MAGDEVLLLLLPPPAPRFVCGEDGLDEPFPLNDAALLAKECSLDLKYFSGSFGLLAGLFVGIRDLDGLFKGL